MAGDSVARFEGYSELFFPRAGAYSIQVANAEALDASMLWGASRYPDYYGRKQELTTVDTGVVSAPDCNVGNLSFRRFHHAQPISLNGTITASLRRDSLLNLSGTIVNGTKLDLKDVQVYVVNQKPVSLGDLKRGEQKAISSGHEGGAAFTPFILQYAQRRCAFLTGTISGEPFGPNIGNYIESSTHVRLIVSLPLSGENQ